MLSRFDLRNPETQTLVARRLALFFGMMMSGGLFIFPRMPMLFGILILAFFVKGSTLGFRRSMGPIFLLLGAVFAVSLIGSAAFYLEATAIRYANFLGGLLLLGLYIDSPRDTLAQDFYFFGKIFSVQVILTIIFSELANGLFSVSLFGDTEYMTIAYVFTYHVMLEDSTLFFRPDGFFYEPAVLQIYLNIHLYLCLFVFKNRKWAAAALLAVLASQSTTALIIGLTLLTVYYIRLLPTATPLEKFGGLVLAPILAIPLFIIASHNFESKFQGMTVGSKWAREYDAYTGLNIAMHYPLTGIGFDNDRYEDMSLKYGYMETQLGDRAIAQRAKGNSNGIVMVLYTMGIPLALIFFIGLFRQRFFRHKLLVAAVVFTSLMPEPLALNPFFLMLAFSGLLHVPSRPLLPSRPYGGPAYPRPVLPSGGPRRLR